jgi:neutral ceramidase
MMGFAMPDQTTEGIHTRAYSRAFVFEDEDTGKICAFVSADIQSGTLMLLRTVVEKLEAELPGVFSIDNVGISGQHTHSNTAGYFQYALFQVTSFGADEEVLRIFSDGVTESIVNAYKTRQSASILANAGELLGDVDTAVNRSPSAYLNNPAEERARYEYDHDKLMTMFRFVGEDGDDMGMLNFYATHNQNVNNTNRLINADSKGYASILAEKAYNPDGTQIGKGEFVAAFANSNKGDVSPNTSGAICRSGPNQGMPCDFETSQCPDDNGRMTIANCWATGPGEDSMDSARIMGIRQWTAAQELFEAAATPITGPIDYRFAWVQMNDTTIEATGEKTCPPGMGYGFAAGTTDGPGVGLFYQSQLEGMPFIDRALESVFGMPDLTEYRRCHEPKPVLLPTAYMECGKVGNGTLFPNLPVEFEGILPRECLFPYSWHPTTVEVQVFRIGSVFLLQTPGEFTTMAGRRLREHVRAALIDAGLGENTQVIIASDANSYTHYITTPEEYRMQRYEGGSTIYGINTLAAYMQEYTKLAVAIVRGEDTVLDVDPAEDLRGDAVQLRGFPVPDVVRASSETFGSVLDDVSATTAHTVGSSVVSATFRSASPGHNTRRGGTFLTVERLVEGQQWETVHTDADWETKFMWALEEPDLQDVIAAAEDGTGLVSCLVQEECIQLVDGELDVPTLINCLQRIPVVNPNPACASFVDVIPITACVAGCGDEDAIPCILECVVQGSTFSPEAERWMECSRAGELCQSRATVEWTIPADALEGTYRLRHFGTHGDALGFKTDFEGTSSPFEVRV